MGDGNNSARLPPFCLLPLPCHLWHMSMRSKGWFVLLNTINYLENAMGKWLEGNNNNRDQSLLTSHWSVTELSLTGKSNSSRKTWIVSVHGISSLGFSAVKEHESHIFTKIFLRSHLWTPPHFHSLQLSPEESVIKLSKKNMYIWCWINVFPRWIY